MLSKWNWIIFNLIVCVTTVPLNGSLSEDEIKAFLQLIELDYEDACYNTANVQWSFIISPSNKTLSIWEVQQYSYAESIKTWKNEVINKTENTKEELNPSLRYKYDVIKKPGDALLKGKDWEKLIHFAGTTELQQSIIGYTNKSHNYSREDVEYFLSHSGRLKDKQTAWNNWYHQLIPLVTNYSNNLLLVSKAAKENDAKNVKEYWEMLSGYSDGYDKVNNEWSRINNLYKKILKFISTNLAQKHEFVVNDTLPAYLLGGLQRCDWTDISSDVLPYSELIYGIKKNLWKKKYLGKSLYKTASKLGSILLKQVPQAEFWDKSEFNQSCPSRLLNFCQDGTMRVSTCSKATMSNFLRAHEDMGKILFNQMTVESTPILNTINRYSGLEEGISTLFGILSLSPAWLNHTHLMNSTNDNEQRMIVSLIITALNVLPRLAYYYSADLWRLNAIQEKITDPTDLISSWWKHRQEYEGVSSMNTDNPTFLDDSHIIMNKPYLPKILGIMISFLLYEYTLDSTEVRYNGIDGKLMNGNIIKMIQQSGAFHWQDILDKFVDIDDVSADALISYFTPLEEFIEENEKKFKYKSGATADKELEELEKHILQEINTPTVTSQLTTTISSITTKDMSSLHKIPSNAKNMQTKVEKSLESKSSVYTQEDKLKNSGSNLPNRTSLNKSSLTLDTFNDTQYSTHTINTSKAVWAVSAVLVALVIICIIAIFGRRRCRKTPKNRRCFRYCHGYRVCGNGNKIVAQEGIAVMEEPQTPGSDCNSNPATDSIQQDLVGSEFVQDNVEYQWFIDYGYRDGGLHIHPSVISSLSVSYSSKDLGYYDDLARNLDANLAEIDMESFRTADIHTLLTALPVMCTEPAQHSEFNYQREQFASISGSVMEKLDIGSSISPHTSSQGEDSACSTADTISICKSSLLFSPVKETSMLPSGGSYSVDSLDCEDMLLTCQTNNKNNYTIAFEGSMTMYSDGSQDFESHDKHKTYESSDVFYDKQKDMKTIPDLSMACSDSKIYTTWSNLKYSSMNKAITRHPSGNNNMIPDISQNTVNLTLGRMSKRSQSLPDFSRVQKFQHANIPVNFSVDSTESNNLVQRLHNSGSMSYSTNAESFDNTENACTKKLQNLSLVRLFMKQKSMSVEGMSFTLDQSDSTSDNNGSNSSNESVTNTNTQIQRQDNVCDRRVSENDFSINWIRRDMINNRDMENQRETLNTPKCASRNKNDKVEMMSSTSIEEFSESISKSACTSGQQSFDIINDPFEHQQKNVWVGLTDKQQPIFRTMGIQANAEMEDNAIQTSLIFTAVKEKHGPFLQETIVNKKPVYIVYPNYTLPDLSFLKIKDTEINNLTLKPHMFDKNNVEWKRTIHSSKPFSCNDIDALRQRGFAHIKDWESLTFLLPYEYKKILHDVPEVSKYININEEVKRPLFCLSPPVRHKIGPISEFVPTNTSSTSSTATQPSSGYRGSSTILTDSSTNQPPLLNNAVNPLYLYRYDSISSETSLMNNDKKIHMLNQTRQACPSLPRRSVSLLQGEDEPGFNNSRVPPRPPLPRSILRKNKILANKRYSMFEMGDVGEQSEELSTEINKRMSLQEPYYMNNDLQLLYYGRAIDSEKDVDETEAERCFKEKLNEITNNTNMESEVSQHNDDDIKQLEEYLKHSAISSQSDGDIENAEVKVRSHVRKFLALKMNKDPLIRDADIGESQRKTVSFAVNQKKKHLDAELNNFNAIVNDQNQDQEIENRLMEFEQKRKMVSSVNRAVDLLLKYWNADSNHSRPNYNERNECAQICLSTLCPALYTIMSDGLKPYLNSTFGPITNSVWQIVEASSQQGPLTKTLNELVQKINGEDIITEGMLKFHAFVFGLLNLRALDAWFAYLCTRESILRKHYSNNSLFVAALANANAREIVDSLLYILNPLAFCPFHLDLLYQYRQLQNSFGNMNSHTMNAMSFRNADLTLKDLKDEKPEFCGMVFSPKKTRPKSRIAYNVDDKYVVHKDDFQNPKKHFSALSSKTFYTLDKFTSEDSEDYTDSLEHSSLNRKANKQPQQSKLLNPDSKSNDDDGLSGETRFRKLQEKWEFMIGKEGNKIQSAVTTPSSPVRTFGTVGKSKIPRLLTSPIKQFNIAANTTGKPMIKSPISGIPSLKKPAILPTTKTTPKKSMDTKTKNTTRRTSRVDQDILGVTRTARPSSLPYKSHGITSNDKNVTSPHRRAASTSLPRPAFTAISRTPVPKLSHKEVRTLTHRIPSDTGQLSFAEGEKLKVILEMDNKWLLCMKGDRRGLVPRACVRSVQT